MDILSDFGVQPALLVAQIINFTILLVILWKLAYKPIIKMLDERKARIAESMAQAQQIDERLAKLATEIKEELKKTRVEADAVIADAKQTAAQLSQDVMTEAKAQSESIIKRAEVAAKLEFEQSKQTLKKEIVILAVTAAEKATRDVLTREQKIQLTEHAAKDIAS